MGSDILGEIIGILVDGITEFGVGIGTGLSGLVQGIFLQTTGTGESAVTSLSVFGVVTIVFMAISLTIGLSRWVCNWITSLGN